MWLTKGLKKNKRQEYIKVKKMHNIHRNVVSNQCIGTTSKECKSYIKHGGSIQRLIES